MQEAAPKSPAAALLAFEARLSAGLEQLPKRLRQCAEFIAAHPERLAFATVAETAAAAGVQPSAVMRFAQVMGLSGYSELQRLFRARYAPPRPDYAGRLEALHAAGTASPGALLAEFAEAGRQSLDLLRDTVDEGQFDAAAKALSQARVVHIIGFRRAYPIACYLAYALEGLGRPAVLTDRAGMLGQDALIAPQDAVIAISFAPYTPATVETVRLAHARGARVTAISDSIASPLKPLADHWLRVAETEVGAFRTLSASITLATALAVALGASAEPRSASPSGTCAQDVTK